MANILIVDDEQSFRQLLSLVFSNEGHNIRTAMNGRQALELLAEEPSDVIISDVKMPDMDGIELLRAVRETQPEIGVVLMTAFAGEVQLDQARKAGVTALVAKPVDTSRLVALVREQLDGPAEP